MQTARAHEQTGNAWTHAIIGGAIAIVSIGAGGSLGNAISNSSGLTGFLAQLLPGVLISVLAVSLVLLATRMLAKATPEWLGLTGLRSSTLGFLKGAGITLGCAVLVFATATAVGWVSWGELQLGPLLAFLIMNAVVAVLLEAFPEELALRGYAFGSLRKRYGSDVSVFLTTVVFVVVAMAISLVFTVPAAIAAGDVALLRVSPEGQGLWDYAMFIGLLGVLLGYARLATKRQSIWTCIGVHLMVLTVNRVTAFGGGADTGLAMSLQSDLAFLLVPAYMTLAVIAFAFLQPGPSEGSVS